MTHFVCSFTILSKLICYIHLASPLYQNLPKTLKMLLMACAILEVDPICLFKDTRPIFKMNLETKQFQKGFCFLPSALNFKHLCPHDSNHHICKILDRKHYHLCRLTLRFLGCCRSSSTCLRRSSRSRRLLYSI